MYPLPRVADPAPGRRCATLTAVALWAALAAPISAAESLKVVDGDTVAIQGAALKLAGIDAPERCQPAGLEAAEALEMLLQGELTYEEAGLSEEGKRVIVLYANGRNVNHAMVEFGWAWSETNRVGRGFADEQEVARDSGVGIWSGPAPIPPCEWRRTARPGAQGDCAADPAKGGGYAGNAATFGPAAERGIKFRGLAQDDQPI